MDLTLNAQRFSGEEYINTYDCHRPSPPPILIEQALHYLGLDKAATVLDLGCGTGKSALVWDAYAERIIGAEPSEAMLAMAKKKKAKHSDLEFTQDFANDLSLDTHSVDIITCSQSFHWMEPKTTLREIDRVLKRNGVFLIYDVAWPPSLCRPAEEAYLQLFQSIEHITNNLKESIAHRWPKHNHFRNVKSSGYFHFLRQSHFHKTVPASMDHFAGIALSQGSLEALLIRGFSEEEIGVKIFMKQLSMIPPENWKQMTFHYTAIYGVK